MASILVTGAAGFLGRHFFEELKKNKGDDIIGVDDFSSEYAKYPSSINEDEFYIEDVRTVLTYYSPEDFDYVYHFAAPVGGRIKIESDPLYNAESLSIDSELFRWASASKTPPTIVYPSSSAVYPTNYQGRSDHKTLREEDFSVYGDFWGRPDEMYGFTKMAGEVLAEKASKYGVNTLVLRPFSGYGEDQPLDYPMPRIIQRAVRKEDPLIVWGPGTQARDFIHVDDIVRLTQMILNKQTGLGDEGPGVKGYVPMNMATGKATDFIMLARIAAKAVGYEPEIATIPSKPFGVYYRVGSKTKLQGWTIDQPKIGLEEGIERMVRYYSEQEA